MADVLLRDSVDQLRALVREGNYSQALALGQHILSFFPKHIETYTVLAQLSLTTNDLAGANDLLKRVLSADPENVLALAGMALISEAQEKHDDALWYLERAYEIQPANDELRSELLRVREMFYGAAPGRIELTAGALARVYARQGQYAQAINEFRRILRNDSKRYDARVALAEVLYRAGRTDEAAQVAQQVMADAPYSLKPNLILGALWTENAVPEGQQFLQRAHQLDPEHRVARALLGERFDGTHAPRLPELGDRAAGAPEPARESAEPYVVDSETARAVQMWNEIERAQEMDAALEEPLFADPEALERVAQEPPPSAAPPPRAAEPSIDLAARLAAVSAPATPAVESDDATLQEILLAEKMQTAEQNIAAPALPENAQLPPELAEPTLPAPSVTTETPAPAPASNAPPAPPQPSTKFAERLSRGKSGEGLSTDAIAAAAAALASSIALDKANQPSPTRRAHPAIPKVRPVIRGAQEKLPTWLFITGTQARAPASFEQEAPSTADQGAPTPAVKDDRPEWLVEAQAVSTQEHLAPAVDSELPDWLKPSAPSENAVPRAEPPAAPANIPTWLSDQAPQESPPAPEHAVSEQPSVVALPEWLQDETPTTQNIAPVIQATPTVAEDWTNEPTEKLADEFAGKTAIENELTPLRAHDTRATVEAPNAADGVEIPVQAAGPETQPASVSETTSELPSETPAEQIAQERAPTQAMPDSATMLQMARDKRAAGDLKGALELYERVMHRRPNYLDDVTNDLQEIIQNENAPTSANRLLGEAYAMAGRFKESLAQYRIAMGK